MTNTLPNTASTAQTIIFVRRQPPAAHRVRIATAAHISQRLNTGTPATASISRKNVSERVSLPSAPVFGSPSVINRSWIIAASVCRPYGISNHDMNLGTEARSVSERSTSNVRALFTISAAASGG